MTAVHPKQKTLPRWRPARPPGQAPPPEHGRQSHRDMDLGTRERGGQLDPPRGSIPSVTSTTTESVTEAVSVATSGWSWSSSGLRSVGAPTHQCVAQRATEHQLTFDALSDTLLDVHVTKDNERVDNGSVNQIPVDVEPISHSSVGC